MSGGMDNGVFSGVCLLYSDQTAAEKVPKSRTRYQVTQAGAAWPRPLMYSKTLCIRECSKFIYFFEGKYKPN